MAKKRSPHEGAKPKGKRKPILGDSPKQRKRPIQGSPTGADPTLVWGFSQIDLDGPYGWRQLTADHLTDLQKKCEDWETMRQSDLFGHGGNKRIPLHELSSDAKKRLISLELDDVDALWELRLSGKRRLWGMRLQHVFYLLWWDPEHEVCPSKNR